MTDRLTARLHVADEDGRRFVTLDAGGTVTAYCGHVDLGTGIGTALSQIVAEELDQPIAAVEMVLGDTARTPDQGPTIASETIQVSAVPLRQAAATLRARLIARAALRLNTDPESVSLGPGAALAGDERVALGDLLAPGEETVALDPAAPLKPRANYAVVGQPTPRRDLEAKLRGDHLYVHDVTVDGMLHGHVIRPPYAGRDSGDFIGRSLLGWDEAAIADAEGFVATVREGDFLAVVATRADIAQRLAERLPVRWRMPPPLPELGAGLAATIRAQPSTERVLDVAGDVESAINAADRSFERTYVWPYHLHGSIGPSCAVADWKDGSPVIWSGTQNPHMLQEDLAQLCGIAPEAVEIRRHQAAGCYGRNCADDVAGDALLLSRAVGRPVRVQLTRAQENLWEPKGAAQVMDVRGALKDGAFHAYTLDTWYPSNRGPNLALLLTGAISPEPRPVEMGDRTAVPPYSIPHKRIAVHDLAPIVRAAWMRGVSALPNTFAHECFVDELAHAAGEDPVAFRLAHVADPRKADLIRRTAEAAGWEPGARPRSEGRMAYGRGFAFATYVHGTFPGVAAATAAWVCDVAVDTQTGEITLTRVFVGQDQGLVINPDGVRQQIHGNVHQTAGRVLTEEVTFDEIAPTQRSWADYPIMRFPEAPEIETMLVERPEDPPLGVGESAAVPSAAAIAGAIFHATGVRLREVPFTPERMREGLRDAGWDTLADPAPAPAPPAWAGLRRTAKAGGLALAGALTFGAVSLPIHRAIPAASSFPTASAETVELGRQLFLAGNCGDCHTAEDGVPNAGGRPFETPFGTIYSTNLTPDAKTGLGHWSFAAFERAMRHGISRDGTNLYPAFPFTSFAGMTEPDLMALHAYLGTLEPVAQATPQARMVGPAALRPANAAWSLAFHDATPLTPDPAQSDAWNRGRYLVETVGHCSACHSPRNAAGAEKGGAAHLAGAMVGGWYAPPIAGPEAAARGWTKAALADYLATGHADGIASAAGPMAKVAGNLAQLPRAEAEAMATYLATLLPEASTARPPAEAAIQNTRVHRLFETACAACHAPALPGMVTAARLPLTLSAAVRAPSAATVEAVIREGIRAPDGTALRDMPGFAGELPQEDIAALARYLRARFAADLPAWPAP